MKVRSPNVMTWRKATIGLSLHLMVKTHMAGQRFSVYFTPFDVALCGMEFTEISPRQRRRLERTDYQFLFSVGREIKTAAA